MSTGLQTNNHNALTRVIQFVCNPVDTPKTIMHKRMQFNAKMYYIYYLFDKSPVYSDLYIILAKDFSQILFH